MWTDRLYLFTRTLTSRPWASYVLIHRPLNGFHNLIRRSFPHVIAYCPLQFSRMLKIDPLCPAMLAHCRVNEMQMI